MKVVHINYADITGGAAIAAYRHSEAMRRKGIDSSMLVVNKKSKGNDSIHTVKDNKYVAFIQECLHGAVSRMIQYLFHPYATFGYSVLGYSVHEHPLVKEADVIYLHWVGNSMINIKGLEKILMLGKPVYWYMHDMHPMTGGCHYSFDCEGYKKNCSDCPLVRKNKGLNITHRELQSKLEHWSKYDNLRVVTPSAWLANCARESIIFKGHSTFVCPNILDMQLFKPMERATARRILNIGSEKKLILFGADSVKSEYKGWEYLKEVLNRLPTGEYECLVFGAENTKIVNEVNMVVHFLGYLSDAYSLVLAYNAADVFVTPSLADNYPNVVLEALACGLPCVGFDIGGIPDLIHHEENGYLAEYKNSQGLIAGIEYVLGADNRRLSENACKWALEHGDYSKVLDLHKELTAFF